MKHSNTRTLYEYWNTLRGRENAPRRDQINPHDIKWMLPGMFFLEYKGEGKFPFTLAGTELCDHYAMELRGLNMCDFWTGPDRVSFSHALQSVVEECAVGVIGFNALTNLEGSCKMEMLIMPVKSPVRKPPRVLGSIAACETPVWVGNDNEKIAYHEISSMRMMWPGKDVANTINVSPDVSSVDYSESLERIDGNQFTAVKHLRVIDGGRK